MSNASRMEHGPVATYRLYMMHPHTGHIERYDEFEAENDVEALFTVAPAAGLQPMELWHDSRKIHRFEIREPQRRGKEPA